MDLVADKVLYCNSLTRYERWETREVRIGDVAIGASHPIRVQSMTTTDTMDTRATVAQSIRMIEAGCEYVRITAPSIREAENLAAIKAELRGRGYQAPLIADIHFTPNAAEAAARIVEKVRINPGNYADKKKFNIIEYTDEEYAGELERIRKRFVPLVRICREYGTAMRIGTNHGSLSDRIMNRYGDTPAGMVESAMEFLRIANDEGYHDIVLSMKASNPLVMVQAYRLLVVRMKEAGMNYPLHLGVTEAGDGEDGRIKSATGIGTLLEDGLGDTIRVSLTEEPELEIPVARALLRRYTDRDSTQQPVPAYAHDGPGLLPFDPFAYRPRVTREVLNVGGAHVPVVVADLSHLPRIDETSLVKYGYRYDAGSDKWNIDDLACDFIYTGRQSVGFDIPGTLGVICDAERWKEFRHRTRHYPLYAFDQFFSDSERGEAAVSFVRVSMDDLSRLRRDGLVVPPNAVWIFETENPHAMAAMRRMFLELGGDDTPVVVRRSYASTKVLPLDASCDVAGLLLDGFGNGIWIQAPAVPAALVNRTCFGILQATRTRISRTEYISCPSCGRTLFDLQETTASIRARTDHLKGVKIGIMGCIVNGPGEMADADYGYVGTGRGKITLYKGREVVRKNIPATEAVDALIDLIRDNGDWTEKD